VDIYHLRIHRGIGTSPLAAWNTAIAGNAAGILHPANAEKFYIDFLPGETRLIRRDGIQLFNIHYWKVLSAQSRAARNRSTLSATIRAISPTST
jgi:hypothetical protein